MLGPLKSRRVEEPMLVSLEQLVPPNHFYRHLEKRLDLSFVRLWTHDRYADRGRPSIDPVIFFKLQLIMFFEGIRSERKLIETASLNVAHRWYLGYAFDETLPDHSSLTRIRQRFGLPLFRQFFEHVVDLCQTAGLVWGEELFVDATKIPGNAALSSLVPRLREVVDGHLVDLFDVDANEPGVEDATPNWNVLETCRLDPRRSPSGPYQRISDRKVSRTDPDATPISLRDGRSRLGYQDHYLVDGGQARVILHAFITPGDVMENQPFLDQLRRTCFRRKLRPHRVVADATYGTIANIRALDHDRIAAYTPLPDWDRRSRHFPRAAFHYDAGRDRYVCPRGEPLRRARVEWKAEKIQYRADAATCNACALKPQCTTSAHGRQLHRSFHAAAIEQVHAVHGTPAFRQAMRKRQVWIEPLFAEAKTWHGLQRFRLRGLAQVNMEGLLVAAGQNLKRWLAATGWGRRHTPGGSLATWPIGQSVAAAPRQ